MSLSKLRQRHLLTGALPPRSDDEHAFLVANGRCEFCYGVLPAHLDLECKGLPPRPEIPPFLQADVSPAQNNCSEHSPPPMRDHVEVPLTGGRMITGPDPNPDPPPPGGF